MKKEVSKVRIWRAFQYWKYRSNEKFWIKLAWLLPKKLVMWSSIRLIANATTGEYRNQIVPELTAMEALDRW